VTLIPIHFEFLQQDSESHTEMGGHSRKHSRMRMHIESGVKLTASFRWLLTCSNFDQVAIASTLNKSYKIHD
jgi:hypothetical protein